MSEVVAHNKLPISNIAGILALIEQRIVTAEDISPHVTLYGRGMGDKAEALAINAPMLLDSGFSVGHRSVIGMSIAEDIFSRVDVDPLNINDHDASIQAMMRVKNATLLPQEMRIIESICEKYKDEVGIAIRSSAIGDNRGIGIYESRFSRVDPDKVAQTYKEVLASYLSFDAIEFRRTAGLLPGMAVMFEGIIAHPLKYAPDHDRDITLDGFAPALAGYGFTDSKDGPFIIATRGLALNVVTDRQRGFMVKPETSTYEISNQILRQQNYPCSIFQPQYYEGDDSGFPESPLTIVNSFSTFFDRMKNLNSSTRGAHYFEWAMKACEDSPQIFITQIAEIRDRQSLSAVMELRLTQSGFLFESHEQVLGSGIAITDKIFFCDSNATFKELDKFNSDPDNKGYLLIFTSDLISSQASTPMSYHLYSNSSALIVIPKILANAESISSHFSGQTEISGKLLTVAMRYGEELPPYIATIKNRASPSGGSNITVLQDPIKIVADQKLGRFIII